MKNQEKVIILHNPRAGDEDHFRTDLIDAIESQGYTCRYFSIKKDKKWIDHLAEADFAVIAGGDGTVRRVAKELVHWHILDRKLPLAVLPMGTANNLSQMLGIDPSINLHTQISLWKNSRRQHFDLGVVQQQDNEPDFFLEGAGFGLFPALMHHMDTDKTAAKMADSTDEKLQFALKLLHQKVLKAPSVPYILETETESYRGHCLLLEVMNIRSIGPNLILSPQAAVEDGYLDIVCVEEAQRDAFAQYIKGLLDGQQGHPDEAGAAGEAGGAGKTGGAGGAGGAAKTGEIRPWKSWRSRKVTLQCEGEFMHLDDELLPAPAGPVIMEARENILEFLINKPFPL